MLDDWLDDARLAAIAAEHNLSETAYLVREHTSRYALRWFIPSMGVALCGHATLASAHVLLRETAAASAPLTFTKRRAGELTITEADGRLWLDLPAYPAQPVDDDLSDLNRALGAIPREWHAATNYLVVFKDAAEVAALAPDMAALAPLSAASDRGVIATAPAPPGADHHFVSRYFAPGHGVAEDPVTGSAHCTLAPCWAARLGHTTLEARQISARGGALSCVVEGTRVLVGGDAVTVATGTLFLPDAGAWGVSSRDSPSHQRPSGGKTRHRERRVAQPRQRAKELTITPDCRRLAASPSGCPRPRRHAALRILRVACHARRPAPCLTPPAGQCGGLSLDDTP